MKTDPDESRPTNNRQQSKRISRSRLRRFKDHKAPIVGQLELSPDHPAITEGRTIFPARRVWSGLSSRLLKSGHNSRKIGAFVLKGRWSEMPIYTLTLEERATCPRECTHWRDCYGNKMNWSERILAGPDFEWRLYQEVVALANTHDDGFVVRLHVLGDFYSLGYVALWGSMLESLPQLRTFGYTARKPDTPIGRAVSWIRHCFPDRFVIRFSNAGVDRLGATTIDYIPPKPVVPEGIVCPAQTGKTDCCGTCALCWTTEQNIVFIRH